jgi:hypothetical protein
MGKTKRSLSPRGSTFTGAVKKVEAVGRRKTSKESTLSHFSMYKMKPFNIKMPQPSHNPMLSPTATRKKHTDIMLMAEELLLGVSVTALAHSPSLR